MTKCLGPEEGSEINPQTRGQSQAPPNQVLSEMAVLQASLNAAGYLSKRVKLNTLVVSEQLNEMPEEWTEEGIVAQEKGCLA